MAKPRKRRGKERSKAEGKKAPPPGGRKVRSTGKTISVAPKPKSRTVGVRKGHGRSPRGVGPVGRSKRKASSQNGAKHGKGGGPRRLGGGKKSVSDQRRLKPKKPYRNKLGQFSKRPRRSVPKKRPPVKKRPPAPPKKRPPVKKRRPASPVPPPKKRFPPSKKRPGSVKKLPVSPQAFEADSRLVEHLGTLLESVVVAMPGLDLGVKTFINADGSVDGEIRIGNLPDDWRVPDGLPQLKEFLSTILRQVGALVPGSEGGSYWISIGTRFGPSNDSEIGELAELYKRHRGLFQVASYALDASFMPAAQNAVVAIGEIIKAIMERRGLPPTVVFVRYTWTPDSVRPHRYTGESGKEE